MNKVLVLFAHPRTDRSEINVVMAAAAKVLPAVTFVDLYAEYPNFDVDVDREQKRLLDHDVIVFQHPLYWYSSPAILKEWQDLVLEYGFAYGAHGDALDGKILLNAVTCGASREAYSPEGAYGHELRTLLVPFEETARLCRMRYLAPFVLFSAGYAAEHDRVTTHVGAYQRLLNALADGHLDLSRAARAATLSDDLEGLIVPQRETA